MGTRDWRLHRLSSQDIFGYCLVPSPKSLVPYLRKWKSYGIVNRECRAW